MIDGTISLCQEAELPELVALVNAAYRGASGQAGWTSEIGLVDGQRVTLDALRHQMTTTPDLRIYLLREPPGLLACVCIEDEHGARGEPACHISMLAVRPDRQDDGLGRRMLEFAERE